MTMKKMIALLLLVLFATPLFSQIPVIEKTWRSTTDTLIVISKSTGDTLLRVGMDGDTLVADIIKANRLIGVVSSPGSSVLLSVIGLEVSGDVLFEDSVSFVGRYAPGFPLQGSVMYLPMNTPDTAYNFWYTPVIAFSDSGNGIATRDSAWRDSSLSFSGESDMLIAAHDGKIVPSGSFSIALAFKTSANDSNQYIASTNGDRNGTKANGFSLQINSGGILSFTISNGTTTNACTLSAPVFDDGQWHNLIAVRDSLNSVMSLSVDGKHYVNKATTITNTDSADTDHYYVIGGRYHNADHQANFYGCIDEYMHMNFALSRKQTQFIHAWYKNAQEKYSTVEYLYLEPYDWTSNPLFNPTIDDTVRISAQWDSITSFPQQVIYAYRPDTAIRRQQVNLFTKPITIPVGHRGIDSIVVDVKTGFNSADSNSVTFYAYLYNPVTRTMTLQDSTSALVNNATYTHDASLTTFALTGGDKFIIRALIRSISITRYVKFGRVIIYWKTGG